jgi:hypothetical protein
MQAPGKNLRAYPKTRADGVAQVVEHWASKHKVLSSNPNTSKRKNKNSNFSLDQIKLFATVI